MDSDDSVTFEIQSLFYQGAYRSCVDVVSQNTSGSPSDPTTLTRLLYGARSQLALNQPDAALALLPSSDIPDSDSPAAAAVRALSRFVKAQNKGDQSGSDEELHQLNELLDQAVLGDANGQTIRICVATAMMRDDDPVGALETLGMGTASSKEIESVALGVHILLSINRPDLAQKEYTAARTWADDALLIQLIEAYIGLYSGGRPAQQAYYVYDELAQNPAQAGKPSSVGVLTGKAVAHMVAGNRAEAEKVLAEAAELDPDNADVVANQAVLAEYGAKAPGSTEYLEKLKSLAPRHPLVRELKEKDLAFEEALQKHQEALSGAA
ncbi:hypothetical protein FA10DRAFT_274336 [Acaromyces ingoldii]|uniref:Coatomer subunit epsilon n=1 Tax=Acaromyces ingoldii TaxID=215250 RepID=A0A316Z2J3_9BASI|nr:hypothetical protein FA10DRAFT_274336 [Acaromyces ingoldii]PWN94403.1 hypothetical protein FA10DRAFT_274336 [Acaromyces ingoldii]